MRPRIWILGELNVDIIMGGEDVMPEFDKEKLVDSFDTVMGSSSAITASVLAGLGADVRFVGVVGRDDRGAFMRAELERMGVDASRLVETSEAGTGVTLSLSTKRDRAMLTYPGTIPLLTPERVPDDMLADADHVHFGSYFLQEGMRGHWLPLFRRAREAGVTTSFDTGWDPSNRWDNREIAELLACTDYFIPSETEIKHLFGADALDDVWPKLPEARGHVVVKCGSRGSRWLTPDGAVRTAEPYRVDPVDTTGAGDSFNAGYLVARLSGLDGEQSLRWANASGAMATLRIGGAGRVPTREQLEAFMQDRSEPTS